MSFRMWRCATARIKRPKRRPRKAFSELPAGLDALKSALEIEALADYPLLVTRYKINVPSLDAFYDPVRDVARYAGINLEDLIKPR